MADSRPQEVTAVKGRDRFFHGCEGGNAADGACAGGAGSPETRNSNLQRHEGAIAMSQRLGGCAQWMRGEVRVNDVKAGAPRRSGGPGSRRAWGNETTSASPQRRRQVARLWCAGPRRAQCRIAALQWPSARVPGCRMSIKIE